MSVSAGGINPLLLNSLFGGMDLSSLQSLQSLQLAAGLMAFPPPTDPKQAAANAAAASMLPLMLPGMGGLPNMATALPNMFSLGGLFGGNLATATAAAPAPPNSTATTTAGKTNGTAEGEGGDCGETATTKRKREGEERDEAENRNEAGEDEEAAEGNDEGVKKAKRKKMEKEDGAEKTEASLSEDAVAPQIPAADSSAEATINGDAATLLAAAGMSANTLAFNPFLLSTMAPGLLYPSMFLPPGLGGLSLPGFPTASNLAELQNAMAGALGGSAGTPNVLRDQEKEDKKADLKAAAEEEEEEDEDEEGGGESDLAEEKEGEMRSEADYSALEDGGMGEEEEEAAAEEAAASSQKDKSD